MVSLWVNHIYFHFTFFCKQSPTEIGPTELKAAAKVTAVKVLVFTSDVLSSHILQQNNKKSGTVLPSIRNVWRKFFRIDFIISTTTQQQNSCKLVEWIMAHSNRKFKSAFWRKKNCIVRKTCEKKQSKNSFES